VEKERRVKLLSLVALIVAVLGLTVAFAALSQTLTINGSASVDAAEWDIHLENLRRTRVDGSAEVISEPVISSDGKSIKGLNVSLKKPGDYVRYDFNFVNAGTIDAKINRILNGVSDDINYEEGSAEYQELLHNYLQNIFPKADLDGDGVTTDEERMKFSDDVFLNVDNYSAENLTAGKTMSVYLDIGYNSSATELPKGEVVINLNCEFIFTQK